ncbi:uncharacterized protein LOC115396883 [Salarias fasciatus]|nr:uncharacterized protein LOC115396883 [Salarias fasciatus]
MVSDQQNISVSSREPGEYYCVAKNEMGQRASDPLPLFNSRVMKILKFFTTFCVLLFILSLVFLLYRHRKNKLIQQRPTNTRSCCSFQMKSSRSRNRMNEAALTGPSRSRDDLLPHQSRPDSVPASNISCVYSMVNLPAPSAQRPATQCDAQTEENALNYASLHFEKKHREPKEDVVYARVSKRKVADYENAAFADKTSQPSDYDTDTSEDEVQVTYSMVNFKPKAQHQRRRGDSSSSEENTQYSELNL